MLTIHRSLALLLAFQRWLLLVALLGLVATSGSSACAWGATPHPADLALLGAGAPDALVVGTREAGAASADPRDGSPDQGESSGADPFLFAARQSELRGPVSVCADRYSGSALSRLRSKLHLARSARGPPPSLG